MSGGQLGFSRQREGPLLPMPRVLQGLGGAEALQQSAMGPSFMHCTLWARVALAGCPTARWPTPRPLCLPFKRKWRSIHRDNVL